MNGIAQRFPVTRKQGSNNPAYVGKDLPYILNSMPHLHKLAGSECTYGCNANQKTVKDENKRLEDNSGRLHARTQDLYEWYQTILNKQDEGLEHLFQRTRLDHLIHSLGECRKQHLRRGAKQGNKVFEERQGCLEGLAQKWPQLVKDGRDLVKDRHEGIEDHHRRLDGSFNVCYRAVQIQRTLVSRVKLIQSAHRALFGCCTAC